MIDGLARRRRNYSVYLDYRLQKDAALHTEQSWLSENCSTRIQIKNRKCGIVIKQAAEELTLPAATAPKTNPHAGVNQRADRETSRCLMAAARRPFVRGATAPGTRTLQRLLPSLPCNSAVVIQCIWMQGEDAALPHETEGPLTLS